MTSERASAVEVLERWEAHGASWRVLALTESLAVVELCTCYALLPTSYGRATPS